MSRSKHTRPRRILAAARLEDPVEPRGAGDPSRARNLRRSLKELGIRLPLPGPRPAVSWRGPRIVETRPRPGFHHPSSGADVERTLRFFGEECVYGIRSIELRQGRSDHPSLQLGRLVVPGRIVLYDQRPSPWNLSGRLGEDDKARLERAGARLEEMDGATEVHWAGNSLQEFMLFDVLMHEVGHHLLQHHKGKRLARIARTRDHESFADSFARRCREVFHTCPRA